MSILFIVLGMWCLFGAEGFDDENPFNKTPNCDSEAFALVVLIILILFYAYCAR